MCVRAPLVVDGLVPLKVRDILLVPAVIQGSAAAANKGGEQVTVFRVALPAASIFQSAAVQKSAVVKVPGELRAGGAGAPGWTCSSPTKAFSSKLKGT